METNLLKMVLNTTIVFIVLLIITRLLGKKQMGHLTFFHYITGITIGSLAANIVSLESKDFFNQLIIFIYWGMLTVGLEYLTLNFSIIRETIDGEPKLLISKGKIDEKMLNKVRLTIDELNMLLREESIFSIQEVDYAILETNGKLSVLKKQDYDQLIKKDFGINIEINKYVPTKIIWKGQLIKKNMQELNLTKSWLNSELKKNNVNDIKKVLFAQIQVDGTLHVIKYQ